jgi:WD40 repeat protein/predicted Ser/Thr protein kinase
MPPTDAPDVERALRRAEQIFDEVVDLTPGARREHLERLRHDDRPLHDLVRRLLRADDGMGDFMEHVPFDRDDDDATDEERLPVSIGRYEIVRVVGRGGMGVVYEARQRFPRRRVALKVIHPALISTHWLRRFEREAEVLGRLHHPGIATIYEAGTAEVVAPGRPPAIQPFLAMEFVDGLPLGEYSRRKRLDVRQRLELAARICDAVSHAHDEGIVHRDLKPGNILVLDDGRPKVLDFGIARATGADWETLTAASASRHMIGTIPYMSPEQVAGGHGAVDSASDVYALGVVLYELLSGRLPIDTRDRTLPDALRAIQEQEPRSLGSLDSAWRGDIDAIVGKALRKEKERRYASAGELADDLRRYLRHEPILARAPGTLYQLRRFARRNKVLVGGVVATILALSLGLIATATFARREARARSAAEAAMAEIESSAHQAHLAAAITALEMLDPTSAARALDGVPESLRSWGWRHLRWRAGMHLDESPPRPGRPRDDYAWSHLRLVSPDGTIELIDAGTRPPRAPGDEEGQFLAARDRLGERELWRRPGAYSMREPFRPDGTVVAVGPWNSHAILLLEASTGELLRSVEIPGATAVGPAFSRSGTRIAYHDQEFQSVCILTLETGRVECIPLAAARRIDERDPVIADIGVDTLYLDASGIPKARASPDGRRLLFRSDEGVKVRRIGDRAITAVLGTRAAVSGWTADGRSVVTREPDGTTKSWDAWTDARLPRIPSPPRRRFDVVAVSPDDRLLATAGWRFVTLQDLRSGGEIWNVYSLEPWTSALAFSPDGRRLAVAGPQGPLEEFPNGGWLADPEREGVVNVLDTASGAVERTLPAPSGNVVGLHWSAGGAVLTIATREGGLHTVEVATGEVLRQLARPDGGLACRAFGVGGTRVAIACDPAAGDPRASAGVTVWDVASGRSLGVFRIDEGPVDGVALDVWGERLAAVSSRGRMLAWEVATGALIGNEARENVALHAVAFSPDGKRVVFEGRDGRLRFCAPGDHVHDLVLDSGLEDVVTLRFFHDGSTLLLGNEEALVLLETGPPPEGFEARARAREARETVNRLYAELIFAEDVAERLRVDATLPDDRRRAALELVRARGDHVGWLNSDVIRGIRNRGLSGSSLELLLRKIERVDRLQPDVAEYVANLGKCRYRAGRYAEALASLARADELRRSAGVAASIEDLAFTAMAQWRIGDRQAARRSLRRLEGLVADDSRPIPRPVFESAEEARTLVR